MAISLPAENSMQASRKVLCSEDARRFAKRRLPRLIFDFVEGAAGREVAAARNVSAFDDIELQPRVMELNENRSLKTWFLNQEFGYPFGIAPMGMCNLVWPGADTMMARAAAALDIPLCVSCFASSSITELRQEAGENSWLQLYVNQSAEVALAQAERAQQEGYEVLVLTVDVPQLARRVRDLRNGFQLPFKLGPRQFLDLALHPSWSLTTLVKGVPRPRSFDFGGARTDVDRSASRVGADWRFLDRLRALWNGKLIVKGVTAGADAKRVRDRGADAVYVSTHGGRQLDSAPSAISILPRIREAVGPTFPIVFDSGVRSGEDIAKALVLGADFVMVGRPALYAIGADGERGLLSLLKIMAEELDLTLAQLGLGEIGQLSSAVLAGAAETGGLSGTDITLRIAAGLNGT
ncbi:MAG: alpha-hydroxy acid oxidase [Pseudomonadota bacterium]